LSAIKNEKKRLVATLLTLCLLTLTLTVATNSKATDYINVNWGHMLNPDPYDEEYLDQVAVCGIVTDFMSNKAGWTSWNAYHTYTTSGYLNSSIDYRQANDVWAHDFWVGDFYPTMQSGAIHYNFYGEGGNNIHDYSLYYRTGYPYSKQHFTFIWTCASEM